MSKTPSRNFLTSLVERPSFDRATGFVFWSRDSEGRDVRDNQRMSDREMALRFCAFRNVSLDGVIELNGPFGLELGGFDDVLNHQVASEFKIVLGTDAFPGEQWTFSQGETELYASVAAPSQARAFSDEPRSFQYLSADRFGPRVTQGSAALPPQMLGVGCRGEFCAQLLDTLEKTLIDESRRFAREGARFLVALQVGTPSRSYPYLPGGR